MKGKYVYSFDREEYSSASDTREDALRKAFKKANELAGSPTTVFIGQLVPADPQAKGHAREIVKSMRERARKDLRPDDGKYLQKVSAAQLADLDAQIEKTILGWLESNKLQPKVYKVTKVTEHPIPLSSQTTIDPDGDDEVSDLGNEDRRAEAMR